jgi:hypothetical protein
MLTRSTSFGPTCRLASSPKVGPEATVGTLKLGYPLLLYKDAVLMRLSLSHVVKVLCVGPSHESPQSRAATLGPQRRPTPPHGRVRSRHVSREGDILQGINSGPDPHGRAPDPRIYSPDPQGWSLTSTCASRTPGIGSRPPSRMGSGPPTVGSQGPRTEHTRALNRTQAGVRYQHMSRPSLCGPVRMRFCSLPRRRPDAATWPTARDVNQRAEPNVGPPGYAAPAFIADKARRLSIPLTSNVPPRHLMRPVHSADRRQPVHSTDGVPVHSTSRQHAHTAACTALIITRTLPRKLPLHINIVRAADIRALGD